jgi:hypothetical protein
VILGDGGLALYTRDNKLIKIIFAPVEDDRIGHQQAQGGNCKLGSPASGIPAPSDSRIRTTTDATIGLIVTR